MKVEQYYKYHETITSCELRSPCLLRNRKIVEICTKYLSTSELKKTVAYFKKQCNSLKLFEKDEDGGLMFNDEIAILNRYYLAKKILTIRIEYDETIKSFIPEWL